MIDLDAMPIEVGRRFERLRAVLSSYGTMVVAYSGGVDSGLLTYASRAVLGDRMIPVIGVSPSLPRREKDAAIGFLEVHGIPYRVVETHELGREGYRRNSPNRCYFCKAELFELLRGLADDAGFSHVAHGANLDDFGDHRPGALAAAEQRVVAPLVDAGLDKQTTRDMARALGLSLWDKPAAPCLASRIPYFQEVTSKKLGQIEKAEYVLKDLGFAICRVRHHGRQARIEVPRGDHRQIRRPAIWASVVDGFKAAGFQYVTLEEDGFRSGRLNDGLKE